MERSIRQFVWPQNMFPHIGDEHLSKLSIVLREGAAISPTVKIAMGKDEGG